MDVRFGITKYIAGKQNHTLDGIGNYSIELYKQLCRSTGLEVEPFSFGLNQYETLINRKCTVLDSYFSHLLKGNILSNDAQFTSGGRKPDLIHATDHLVPIVKNIPVVTTIMDAIPISNPEWVSRKSLSLTKLKFFVWKSLIKRSDLVITISQYSKKQIVEYFGFHPDNIYVTPLAVDERFYSKFSTIEKVEVLEKFGIKHKNFFLSVGTLQPRKNIIKSIQAMSLLPMSVRKQFPIVIVGRLGWSYDEDVRAISQAVDEGWCYWLKRVPDIELRTLLQSAKALLFPSLAEGFGLPVLEAFASETPVMTSNTSSLPEVAGDAALLVNPNSIESIKDAIERLVSDEELCKQLVVKGLEQSKMFTWENTALKTVEVYKKLL